MRQRRKWRPIEGTGPYERIVRAEAELDRIVVALIAVERVLGEGPPQLDAARRAAVMVLHAAADARNAVAEERRRLVRRQREAIDGAVWDRLRMEVFRRDGYRCAYCGNLTQYPHADHVLPVSRGGRTTLDNLVTACRSCNGSKGNRLMSEWEGVEDTDG